MALILFFNYKHTECYVLSATFDISYYLINLDFSGAFLYVPLIKSLDVEL